MRFHYDFGLEGAAESVLLTDVVDGIYRVHVVIGDRSMSTCTNVKTNGERLVIHNIMTAAGEYVRESFAVHVRGGRLKISLSGRNPTMKELEIVPAKELATLFLVGDSTVSDWSADKFPETGWGQVLPSFFTQDVAVENQAKSGRSSKSFLNEGRLDAFLGDLKAGDFLFIQFGHNDQKEDEERHTDPATTYPEYLRRYIDAARRKGATPVLITSVHRRRFEEDGRLADTHGPYHDAVRTLAASENVPLIDLAEKSKQLFERLGPEGTKSIFMWSEPGEWSNYPDGVQDNTHFQERGSLRIAELVVEGIRELNLMPLALHLRSYACRLDA